MNIRDVIRDHLEKIKISIGQLDPNGLCNAGCWFCPVRYEGNPLSGIKQMYPSDLRRVLKNIRTSTVTQDFNLMYTAHYNEVLLYKHFEEMLALFEEFHFLSPILTNGTGLTPERQQEIMKHLKVVTHIVLNIPSLDPQEWSKLVNLDVRIFDVLMRNLEQLHETPLLNRRVRVIINKAALKQTTEVLANGFLVSSDAATQFRERFPRFTVDPMNYGYLIDRAGKLAEASVLKNRTDLGPRMKVIACGDEMHRGSRLYGWLHVNSHGDAFVCCNDYDMTYKFGNLLEAPLDEIWLSERHVDAIEASFDGLCRRCIHHRFSTS